MHATKFWAMTGAHLLGVSNFLTICHDVFTKRIIFRTGPRKWKLCYLVLWCNIWKKRKLPVIKTPKVPISELSLSLVTGLWDLFDSLNRHQINPSINNKKKVCEIAVSPLHEMCWLGFRLLVMFKADKMDHWKQPKLNPRKAWTRTFSRKKLEFW